MESLPAVYMEDHFLNDLSMSFVMDLYRTKIKAEKRDDKKDLESLQQHYPKLFSDQLKRKY